MNTIIRAQLFDYSNNPNIRGNTDMKIRIIFAMKIATTLGWLAVSGMCDWAKSSSSSESTTVIEVAEQ